MDYMTLKEASEKWDVILRRVNYNIKGVESLRKQG